MIIPYFAAMLEGVCSSAVFVIDGLLRVVVANLLQEKRLIISPSVLRLHNSFLLIRSPEGAYMLLQGCDHSLLLCFLFKCC